MRTSAFTWAILAAAAAWPAQAQAPHLQRALLYSKNTWRHNSIPFVSDFVKKLGQEKGFRVDDAGTDATVFNDANLASYDIVVLNNNVGFGNTLNDQQKAAFQKWHEAGGGVVGFHGILDHLNAWAWFSDIVGTRFVNHSAITNAVMYIPEAGQGHPIVAGYGQPTQVGQTSYPRAARHFDEYYNYTNNMTNVSGVTVLLQMAHGSYLCSCDERVMTPTAHQAAWIRQYRGGRQFMTTLGGVPDNDNQVAQTTFHLEPTKTMLHRAMLWAAGDPLTPIPIRPRADRAFLLHASALPSGGWDLSGRKPAGWTGPVLILDRSAPRLLRSQGP